MGLFIFLYRTISHVVSVHIYPPDLVEEAVKHVVPIKRNHLGKLINLLFLATTITASEKNASIIVKYLPMMREN